MAFMGALTNKLTPKVERAGFGFMLVGDEGISLSDPFATDAKDVVKSGVIAAK